MNFIKCFVISIIFLFYFIPSTLATHIVGGEMTYRCLGNDQYEISLKVYRDCDNGVPWFDNVASVSAFNAQNNSLYSNSSIQINTASNDTLNQGCFASLCVHYTTYKDTLHLPQNNEGYIIAYQRCCRNNTISNLSDPSTAGMTISLEITSTALSKCNNSPTFINEVPSGLTLSDTFSVDLSAIDIDGDSLAYSFYAPYNGGSIASPRPDTTSAPPFSSISYLQGFNAQSAMQSNPTVLFDSITGMFSGKPLNTGAYVFGLSISEYDSTGTLLSKVFKDFTIAVGTCSSQSSTTNILDNDQLKIYPNPTRAHLTIELEHNEPIQLRLFSVLGQEIVKQSFMNQTQIDISTLPKGVFLLEIETATQRFLKKIIKN
ncbi:MAG: T9SS type A sorting domain-containing protein [Aureispira sp.]|nr:T9SS type A sorting domain-containing protein [Aureispira sp.]